MLFLTFQLGKDCYALEANRVLEVLPLLELKRLPHAPKGLAGLINLRGRPVPTIDLNELTNGQPARERLTTRIIVINHIDDRGGDQPLGLIAEYVTQTLRRDPADFVETGVTPSSAPYLGPVLLEASGPIQWLRTEGLVSEPIRQLLWFDPATGAAGTADCSAKRADIQ